MQGKVRGFAPTSQNNLYLQRPSCESQEFFVYFATYYWGISYDIAFLGLRKRYPRVNPDPQPSKGAPHPFVQACWKFFAHALSAHACKFPQLEGTTGLLPNGFGFGRPQSLSFVNDLSRTQFFTNYYLHAVPSESSNHAFLLRFTPDILLGLNFVSN